MNVIRRFLPLFLVFAFCLSIVACVWFFNQIREAEITAKRVAESANRAAIEAGMQAESKRQRNLEIQRQILDILNSTRVDPMWVPTIGQMVKRVFFYYNIEYFPHEDYDTIFEVVITGSYCPVPDLRNLSMDGSITYLIGTETKTCMLFKDPNQLTATFMLFIVNSF